MEHHVLHPAACVGQNLFKSRFVFSFVILLNLIFIEGVKAQDLTLVANTSSTASGLYGLSTGVSATSGSGNSLITVSREATTINQKNLTPTAGCFGTSKIYLISSASGGQIKISLPNTGDYYLDKVELLLSSNNTGATLSGAGANGHYKWIQADGTTYSADYGIGGLTGYDQYATICSSPLTMTAVTGAKSIIFGRGTIGGTAVGGAEFRIWQIRIWIKQVVSCTTPTSKTVSGTASICSGNSTNITLASSQSGVGYDLYKDGSIVASSSKTGDGNDLTWSVSTAGTYTIKTNSTGGYCDGTAMSGSAVVTVNALPTPTFTSAPTTSARYTNVSYTTQASQSSYVWTISGVQNTDYSIVSGGTSNDNSVTLQWLTTGTKTVSVNYNNSNSCTATSATSTNTDVTSNLDPPTLSANGSATVDAPFNITFTDDASWRTAVTDVIVGGVSLAGSAYSFSAGTLTLSPANDSKLQTNGAKSVVVIATGYNNATVSQSISAGAVTQWAISTQPATPSTNHGALATQPIIIFKDQYNNVTGSGSVTATASSGWALGGTTSISASSGVATFNGLTASTADYSALNGATITFSTSGLSDLTSNTFNIPAYSSATTDYFRSKITGNWNDAATWESSPDNSNWFNATAYPDASANTVTLLHNVSYAGTPTTVGNVTVNSGITLTNTGTAISVASGKTLTIASGGVYENQASTGASISAGSGNIQVNGIYKTTALNASTSALSFTNISFASNATLNISGTSNIRIPASCAYNVEWSSSASNSFVNSTSNTITGNLTISNAAAVLNNGTGGTGRSVTVTGNLIINNGQYNPQGGTGATQALTVNGNVTLSGAGKLYAVNPSATGTGSISIKGNVLIQSPTSVVIGNGGGSAATLSFTGTSQQTISTDLSTGYSIEGFTLNNSNGLVLGSSLTLSGTTTITSGKLTIGANTLTLNGTVNGMSATNSLTGSASSILNIGGSGAFGNIFMDQTVDGTSNKLSALTINRSSSGTVTLGNKTIVSGLATFTAGTVTLSDVGNTAGTINISGSGGNSGTWGSTNSSATYQNTTFVSTGLITVSSSTAASQSITFGSLPTNKIIGDTDFAPGATSGTSGINAITYSSDNTDVAAIVSNQIHIVGEGSVNITAIQGNSAFYNSTSSSQSFTVIPSKVFSVTVPNGTQHVYIAGDFTNKSWDITTPYELTNNGSNSFSGRFACVDGVNYKYLCSIGDWDYQAAQSAGGSAESNRSYNASDNIVAWYRVPSLTLNASITTGVPVHLYVKGDWDSWATPIELTKSGTTFSTTISGGKYASNLNYKYYTNEGSSSNWESNTDGSARDNRWSVYPVMNDEIARFGTSLIGSLTTNSTTNLSSLGYTNTQLTNTDLVVTGGELTVNNTTTVHSLVVEPGAKITIDATKSLSSSGGVVLHSDASGTATLVNNGTFTNSGSATVQQYLATTRNWYVSSPVSNAILPAGYTCYLYREPGDNTSTSYSGESAYWQGVTTGSTLTRGIGYIAKPGADAATLTFSTENGGYLNDGDIIVPLSKTNGVTKSGFNLVGNPYPSYLYVNAVVNSNDNLEKTVWYRTRTITYLFESVNTTTGEGTDNASTGTTVKGVVPPMQAFWVRTSAPTSLTFTNAMRYHANPTINAVSVTTTPLKAPRETVRRLIRLAVSNGTNRDETILMFDANAQNAFDAYDSQKILNNTALVPDLYTMTGTTQLVINGMNDIPFNTEIPLGFAAGQAGTFTLKASELRNFDAETAIILRDNMLNTETLLTPETEYSFASDVTNTTSRFSVIFKSSEATTGYQNNADDKHLLYLNNSNTLSLNVTGEVSGDSYITVFNALGQQIVTKPIVSGVNEFREVRYDGVYILKGKINGTDYSGKINLNR